MKDLIDIYQLQQHIDKPSRIANCSQTLLDIILTKIDDTKTGADLWIFLTDAYH